MRLINTSTLNLEQFDGSIPPYAILSHAWGPEEVSFQDWQYAAAVVEKAGYGKIREACTRAVNDQYNYLWVDTCCIDKSSSSELSEAINSMFSWYSNAEVCYCYLADIEDVGDVSRSRMTDSYWFSRGWTLQELLAPKLCVFFSRHWHELGTKASLSSQLAAATGIDEPYLTQEIHISSASIARRMSWAAERNTTRLEDVAYSLLGIFDINMPLLYGEGPKAFIRLQEEVMRVSNDQTLFCWEWAPHTPKDWSCIFAPSPSQFLNAGSYVRSSVRYWNNTEADDDDHGGGNERVISRKPRAAIKAISYSMTNAGVRLKLPIIASNAVEFAVLNVGGHQNHKYQACIPVALDPETGVSRRVSFPPEPILLLRQWASQEQERYLQSRPIRDLAASSIQDEWRHVPFRFGFLFSFRDELSFEEIGTGAPRHVTVLTPMDIFDAKRSLLIPMASRGEPQQEWDGQNTMFSLVRFTTWADDVVYVFLAAKQRSSARFCKIATGDINTGAENHDTWAKSMFAEIKQGPLNQRVYHDRDEHGAAIWIDRTVSVAPDSEVTLVHLSFPPRRYR